MDISVPFCIRIFVASSLSHIYAYATLVNGAPSRPNPIVHTLITESNTYGFIGIRVTLVTFILVRSSFAGNDSLPEMRRGSRKSAPRSSVSWETGMCMPGLEACHSYGMAFF